MTAWSRALRGPGLRQPDALSCGACVAEVAAGIHTRTTPPVPATFTSRVLARHRQLTSARDVGGRAQVPWPRWWGTPPWALARHLGATSGVRHRVAWVRTGAGRTERRVSAALASGSPVALYVGSALLPRHVLLALPEESQSPGPGAHWTVYDPASGRTRPVDLDEWRRGRLGVGWSRPWWVVVTDPVSPRPAPRRPV